MAKSSTPSPIDDLTYDVITVLHAKAKALEAYDKYVADARDDEELTDLFVQMRHQDEENIQVLKEVLARRLDEDLGFDEDEDDVDDLSDDEDGDLDEDYEGEDEDEVEPPARGEGASEETNGPPRRGESGSRRS